MADGAFQGRGILRRAGAGRAWRAPAWLLAQYQHRSFGAADGLPGEVVTIGQASDGMLWLGATTGIHTFDGQRFLRHPVEFRDSPRQPYFLRGDPSGGIWIGWVGGGVTLVRGRELRHYDVEDGIPAGTVWGFAFDRQGRVWAAGKGGLARFDGRRWRRMTASDGFDAATASAVSVDREGNIGVFSEKGLYLLPAGARRFEAPLGSTETRQPLAIGPQGQLYFVQKTGIRRIAAMRRYEQPDFPLLYRETAQVTGSFLADRHGGLWFDSTAGLHRLPRTDTARPLRGALRSDTETITRAGGLSGRIVYCLFEDARGTVWAATDGGLDRFFPSELEPIVPDGRAALLVPSVVKGGAAGDMWLLTAFPRKTWLRIDAGARVRARAQALDLTLRFARRSCEIVIADDGQGIASGHAAGRSGHWGLAGMRERAALIDARLDIGSGAKGTTVRLQLKRRRAAGPADLAPAALAADT